VAGEGKTARRKTSGGRPLTSLLQDGVVRKGSGLPRGGFAGKSLGGEKPQPGAISFFSGPPERPERKQKSVKAGREGQLRRFKARSWDHAENRGSVLSFLPRRRPK